MLEQYHLVWSSFCCCYWGTLVLGKVKAFAGEDSWCFIGSIKTAPKGSEQNSCPWLVLIRVAVSRMGNGFSGLWTLLRGQIFFPVLHQVVIELFVISIQKCPIFSFGPGINFQKLILFIHFSSMLKARSVHGNHSSRRYSSTAIMP